MGLQHSYYYKWAQKEVVVVAVELFLAIMLWLDYARDFSV